MSNFKKFLLALFVFVAVSAIAAFFVFQKARNDANFRSELVYLAKDIKNIIYREATIHNPEGDMLPDQIDNNVISEMKRIFN